MMPDGSGWTAEEDWRERVWRLSDGGLFPACRAPNEPAREHHTRVWDGVSLTVARSGLGEPRARG